jgi:vitamin B12 transporter
MKREITKILMLSFFIFQIFFLSSTVYAQTEEEKNFLLMYFKEDELEVISATRSLKSITRVAENVEVVTAEDIELMNAHTLADVLNTVTGVQIDFRGGPGSVATYSIQGSDFRHVAVFVDGISITNLPDNVAHLGFIPVQFIERIEIIKGPASSTWGSSLGGVINIITKPAAGIKTLNGTLSASYGEENTGDFRFEAHGKKDRFGYYLYAGRLQSDGLNGLRPNNDISENSLFTKLKYDASKNTDVQFTVLYNKSSLGQGEFTDFDFADFNKTENFLSSLSLNTSLSNEIDFSILLSKVKIKTDFTEKTLSTNEELLNNICEDNKYGVSAKLSWKHGSHNIVAGTDYEYGTLEANLSDDKKRIRKLAIFANDTIILNKLSIIAGLRYDNTDTFGDFVSPSLGITYEVFDNTLLRAFVARGFSLPGLGWSWDNEFGGYKGNPELKAEKIWSYQIGVETGALKYLWLKISGFRHDLENAMVDDLFTDDPDAILFWTKVNKGSQRRQGIEIEMKTMPVYNSTLFAGAAFIDISGANEEGTLPKYTYDIGLQYDDRKSLKALLKGHYIWWMNAYNGDYNSFIFNISIIKNLYKGKEYLIEGFLTGHNIFNGAQYSTEFYENPKRWIEAGIRFKF